ncbi:MAG: hypothetical protein U1D30_19265 [Planctomycetota bacterium]
MIRAENTTDQLVRVKRAFCRLCDSLGRSSGFWKPPGEVFIVEVAATLNFLGLPEYDTH